MKSFRYFAEQDLVVADLLIRAGSSYDQAAVHMQQALEKMLKHIFILRNQEAPKTHSLIALYREALPDKLKYRKAQIKELSSVYFTMRYPNDDYCEVDGADILRLWSMFTEMYRELEEIANELESNPVYEESEPISMENCEQDSPAQQTSNFTH